MILSCKVVSDIINEGHSLTKIVPVLYLFYIYFIPIFKLFFPILMYFFSIFPGYFKVIFNYFKPIILKQKIVKKMVWSASHNYCKDSFKIEKICMQFDDKVGLK